ncbi:MAG: type II 3-dehydroquinate dehydratase [Acidimicrobiales bacterium]|nr:type II 3-dehydroquinate dehydratase [Acidimicrobiales bacterium]
MTETLPVPPVRLLVLNGPNLNMLGKREPEVYGSASLDEIMDALVKFGAGNGVEIRTAQSNSEGDLVDAMQSSVDWATGVIVNAGGYSHTSVALRDAISSVPIPVVEVHISNIAARENFRHQSMLSAVCAGVIYGFGHVGYRLAVQSFLS